jgi:hypothetical protein
MRDDDGEPILAVLAAVLLIASLGALIEETAPESLYILAILWLLK